MTSCEFSFRVGFDRYSRDALHCFRQLQDDALDVAAISKRARRAMASVQEYEDTRVWMLAFYRARFTAGRTTAGAARQAALQQLQARRAAHQSTHPLYWGSFIAVGSE